MAKNQVERVALKAEASFLVREKVAELVSTFETLKGFGFVLEGEVVEVSVVVKKAGFDIEAEKEAVAMVRAEREAKAKEKAEAKAKVAAKKAK